MKKILALIVAMLLVLGMTSAFAATITINRDSTWQASTEEDRKATYTWHRIFDADLTDPDHPVYTISGTNAAEKVAALDTNVFAADLASDGKYYITTKSGVTDAAILAALDTLVASNATLFPGTPVTSAEATVTLNVGDPGYFYIEASNGKDVAVQTAGSTTITEKNDYPTIDKKQKKDSGDWQDTPLPQEIGSYIDYQVTVHVPADATKAIKVFDTMSAGLEYDSNTGLNVTPATASYAPLTSADDEYDANATWQIVFNADTVIANRGQDIVITYRAKVTTAALTDGDKENEVKLSYDNGNYVLTDKVDYETYFAGIYKVDPNKADADMSGVKFDLKDGDGNAVNVTYDATNGYYVIDPNGTGNEVETRADGDYYTIKIRGLDNDKTYTLTETVTKNGYNLLNGVVTLTKTKDEGTAFANKLANTFDRVENNQGSVLPSTGGMGTTLLYVGGSILVLAAVILLVTKRRMGAND